jgi:Protein kinase domain
MNLCSAPGDKTKNVILSVLLAFFSFFSALLLGLTTTTNAQASSVAQPQDVSFAGVSVVRVLSTYTPENGTKITPPVTPSLQCTGLGVIVSSWQTTNVTEMNNWLLTDGKLVDPTQESCDTVSSKQMSLTKIEVFLSSAYNTTIQPALVTLPVQQAANSATPSTIRCQQTVCSDGLALVAFQEQSSHTLPFVNLATTDRTQEAKIALSQVGAAAGTLNLPSPTTQSTKTDQYRAQVQQYMTPQRLLVASTLPIERGTPIVNTAGELTGISTGGNAVASVSDFANWVNSVPELKVTHANPVQDAWKSGISAYFGKNYAAASTYFQTAFNANVLFEGAQQFKVFSDNQIAASRQKNTTSGGSEQPITVNFLGISFTFPDMRALALLGCVVFGVLVMLMILLSMRVIVRRQQSSKKNTVLLRAPVGVQVPQNRDMSQPPITNVIQEKPVQPRASTENPVVKPASSPMLFSPTLPERVESLPAPVHPRTPTIPIGISEHSVTPETPAKENVQPIARSSVASYIGQRLGNYRLKGLLGHGGFADVYLGEHVYLKTNAAIKVLHTRLTSADLTQFLLEARTIAGLIHPHIVRVLEFGVEGGTEADQSAINIEGGIPYLIMDYAPGGTLRQRYPKGRRIPLMQIVSYTGQIAEALYYAHAKKLIHRDIKPENMLLGQNDEVLLSDFGIVAVAHAEHSMHTQEMAGTIPYIAPEQIKGKPRPASDQYSLAVVVYEWLSGTRPFQGDSQWQVIEQHMYATPVSLRTKDASIPQSVDNVVLKALAKDPLQRFDNVRAFAAALEQASRHP